MPRIDAAQLTTAIQLGDKLRSHCTNPLCHGSMCIPWCPVGRLSSPKAASNPHTSTALAAYCKSPYPHRSAPTASETVYFRVRSAVDTALEICIKWPQPRLPTIRRTVWTQSTSSLRRVELPSGLFPRIVGRSGMPPGLPTVKSGVLHGPLAQRRKLFPGQN